MALQILKKIFFLLILILASLLPASFGGGRRNYLQKNAIETGPLIKAAVSKEGLQTQKGAFLHRRVLKVQTKDYETYDPTPALNKPPFKLIPN